MNQILIQTWLEKNNIQLPDYAYAKLELYQRLVLEKNEHLNLTGITDSDEFAVKHFIDSLSPVPLIKDAKTVCDAGTGAGFPGIVLAVALPEINFTLIDARAKRILFLESVVKVLELKNVRCIHTRSEDLKEKFDVVTARAVAPMDKLVKFTLSLLNPTGRLIAMKSLAYKKELESAEPFISKLGRKVIEIREVKISDEIIRNIIIVG